MGTDIHGVVQSRYRNGSQGWQTECEIRRVRNYAWFSILSGVRYWFDELEPVQKERGFPEGFSVEGGGDDPTHKWEHSYDNPVKTWMGDHSYGWATLDEIQAWPHWDAAVKAYNETHVPREVVGEALLAWLRYAHLEWNSNGCEARIVFGFDN